DKPKNIAPNVVKEIFKPNPKQKIISSEIPVLRFSKQQENPKVKAKVKKEESDEDSILKKGKKKEKQLTPKEAAHEKYLSSFHSFHVRITPSSFFSAIKNSRVDILRFLTDIGFSSLHNVSIDYLPSKLGWFAMSKFMLIFDSGDKIEVTPSKIHEMLGVPFGGYSLFDLDERETNHEFVRKWAGQFYPLELKKVSVNDIARKLIAAQEIDFLFKVIFFTLFMNTMGKADGLKGQICLDIVRRLREDSVISNIDWCGYIYDCLRDNKLPRGTNHYLGPLTFLIELELKNHVVGLLDLHDEWNEAEVQEPEGFIGFSETFEKEASLKCHGNRKFVTLHEKYVNLFKDPISFEDDGNGDNVCDDDENGDDDENRDDDGGNVNNDVNDCDVNRDSDDVNEAEKDKAVEGNTTEQGTVVEGNEAEEGEIMSTLENFTQRLEKNVDLVGEVIDSITAEYLYGDKMVILSKSHEIHSESLVIYSEFHMIHSETHVIHSESHVIQIICHMRFIDSESHSKSMFDGTLASFDAKWESFSNQVNAQFKGNKYGLALGGIDLKKLFAHHLKQYGHIRHTQVAKVKHTIPKLKWKTKENFHDCGIFTMLHMETFMVDLLQI
nr:hypothetical protein [Tanacetum cinerariifolium]